MSQHIDPDARRAMQLRERLVVAAFVVAFVLAMVAARAIG